MCNVINLLDESESRACIIWIIGEYSHLIDNANELLELFIDSYHDEKPYVQFLHSFYSCSENTAGRGF